MRRSLVAVTAIVGTGLAGRALGPWQRNWGATSEEAAAVLPGDELTAAPVEQCTRAMTIGAPPEAVWPWLVQMGADRGGFYSYDWLENLFGLDIHNAESIEPEWQRLGVGDMVWANGARSGGWVVERMVPNELLVLKVADAATARSVSRSEGIGFEFQWTFALVPTPYGGTRLFIRERVAYGRRLTRWLMAPVGLVSFVMTRRMLGGIQQRAERHLSSLT
ncbi:MAG TPA: SRPBCC family protein [Ilumatobacteraceae bacterium]|nr:SRPBCC family protein [Ilumatobacteraceae bacterium]